VTLANAAEIVRQHILGGQPVQRLQIADECLNTSVCEHRKRSDS